MKSMSSSGKNLLLLISCNYFVLIFISIIICELNHCPVNRLRIALRKIIKRSLVLGYLFDGSQLKISCVKNLHSDI